MTTEREAEIGLILYYLKLRWLESPEERLGQLLENAARNEEGVTPSERKIWLYGDSKWLEALQ